MSDLHLGAVHCDEKSLIEKVYEIKQYGRQAIVLGGGDYGDCITPNDLKRWDARILAPWLLDDMNEKLPPWMRSNMDNIGPGILRKVDEILSPIWGSFAGLIEGNHDDGIRKHNHYNFMKELLIKANKRHDVKYAGVQCFLVLHFVRKNSSEVHDIIIHARHGEGAARTSGARALAVLRMAQMAITSLRGSSNHKPTGIRRTERMECPKLQALLLHKVRKTSGGNRHLPHPKTTKARKERNGRP